MRFVGAVAMFFLRCVVAVFVATFGLMALMSLYAPWTTGHPTTAQAVALGVGPPLGVLLVIGPAIWERVR